MKPSTARVLGKTWQITYVDELKNDDGESVYGLCDESSLSIKIRTGMALDLEKHTIIHELTHAISYGMDLKLDERQTDLVSGGFMALLHDNPAFAEHLIGL